MAKLPDITPFFGGIAKKSTPGAADMEKPWIRTNPDGSVAVNEDWQR